MECKEIVTRNNMVGVLTVDKGLSDNQLVTAVRNGVVRFGSEESAVYHLAKKAIKPREAYISRANDTIRNPAAEWKATLGQEGDCRFFTFVDAKGKCIVLERDGRVVLCSFTPTEKCYNQGGPGPGFTFVDARTK